MPSNKRTITLEELTLMMTLVYADVVQKESGKGLSTEDFTSALKTKLEAIASGAQVNVLEAVKMNGTALTIDANKAVNIPVMGGANASSNGTAGVVPAPVKANRDKFLKGDGSWDTPTDTTYDVVTELVNGLMSAAMLQKLNGIAEGATANAGTVTGVKANSEAAKTPDSNGIVDLGTVLRSHQDISGLAPKASPTFTGTPAAPTAAAGTNTTQIATTAFVAAAITAALNNITGITFSFVQTLPSTGATGTFYFVPDSSGSGTNNFIEYVWNANSSKFEEVGRPQVDLSGYMQAADYPLITEQEVRDIIAAAKAS